MRPDVSLDRGEILLQRGEIHGAAQSAFLGECAQLDRENIGRVGDRSGSDRELCVRHAPSLPESWTVDPDFTGRDSVAPDQCDALTTTHPGRPRLTTVLGFKGRRGTNRTCGRRGEQVA